MNICLIIIITYITTIPKTLLQSYDLHMLIDLLKICEPQTRQMLNLFDDLK